MQKVENREAERHLANMEEGRSLKNAPVIGGL